jgi:hypothetical protein
LSQIGLLRGQRSDPVVDWFGRTIIATGRLPLFCFFVGMVFGFGFIRFSVRMIRAQVKWWPGNVSPGGTHIHHVVFGVVFMLIGGVAGLAIPGDLDGWRAVVAALFGIGAALVLDEFALILHLDDVYWSEKGRTSIDAVFVAVAFSGLLLVGVRPVGVEDFLAARSENSGIAAWISGAIGAAVNLALAGITLLKGKIWTGLIGFFVPVLIVVGAIRLARPHSPWARWRYREQRPRARRKLTRATDRERRVRRPLIAAKVRFQDFVAGRPDLPRA